MANLGGGADAHARFNLYETGNTSSNGVQELRSSSNSMRDFDARTGAPCVLVGKRTIKREISTMKLIRHPNVIRMYEVMASKTKIYIVMELVTGGELFDKIASRGRLKEDDARRYFQQLINAIDYCHSRGFYHRDLKLRQ